LVNTNQKGNTSILQLNMDQINDAGDTLLKEIGYDGDQSDTRRQDKILSATQKRKIEQGLKLRKQLSKSALRNLS